MTNKPRRPVIGGNWKLNGMPGDCRRFAEELLPAISDSSSEIILAVPFVLLPEAVEAFRNSPVIPAAQNVSPYASGAFTGEVSADQLAALGVGCAIVGHSERRLFFHENDASMIARLKCAFQAGLKVILCVGEGLEVRQMGQHEQWVRNQLAAVLHDINPEMADKLMIAYEPIWAIGSGCSASPADAEAMAGHIRSCLTDLLGEAGEQVPILYGGSVTPENTAELLSCEHVGGLLVGGASLKADRFAGIISQSSAPARNYTET